MREDSCDSTRAVEVGASGCDATHAIKVGAYWFISVGTLALQYAYSIIYVDLLDAFDGSRAATALVGSLSAGVMDMSGYGSGSLIARFGERPCGAAGAALSGLGLVASSRATALWQLYLTYGLMLGVGQSLALYAGVVCVNKWFSKRLALASAVGNTGGGVGPFVMPYLWTALKRSGGGGWRVALAALGAIIFAFLSAAASQLAPPPPRPDDDDDDDDDRGRAPLVDDGEIRRLCWTTLAFGFGFWTPAVHLVRLGMDRGHSRRRSEMLLFYVGIGALTVRVPVGSLGDACGRRRVFSVTVLLYALTQAGLAAFQRSYAGLALFAFLVGSFIGSLLSLIPTLVLDVPCGCPKRLARATGFVCSFLGVGGMAGPVVAGALFDRHHTYIPGFLFGGLALVAACVAVNWPVPPRAPPPEKGDVELAPPPPAPAGVAAGS